MGEVFRPASLLSSQEFGRRKVLEILVVSNDINWCGWTFQVVSPSLECFENCKEFFVMNIIIKFGRGESLGVESYGVKFAIGGVS